MKQNQKLNPYTSGQLIFDKGAKLIKKGKKQSFQQMVLGHWISTCEILKLHHFLTTCTKINSKLIKDLNVRAQTIKLLEESTVVNLCDHGLGKAFLDMTPKA